MSQTFSRIALLVLVALGLSVFSCGKKNKQPATQATAAAAVKPAEVKAVPIAALPKVSTEIALPMLVGPEGRSELSCFQPVQAIEPVAADDATKELIKKSKRVLSQVFGKWLADDLAVDGLNADMASGWEITVEDPLVAEVEPRFVRFVENPECIDKDSGSLPKGLYATAKAMATRVIHFKSQAPLDDTVKASLKRAAEEHKLVVESDSFFEYKPALDDKGQPKVDSKKQPLFVSPEGLLIPEKHIPPAAQRMMKQWTIKSDALLYFAFAELSKDMWAKESKKDLCDVNLIWDDPTPRAPDCKEFQASAFTASKGQNDEIALTITTGKRNKGVTIPSGKSAMVQMSSRILLWLSPKPIEEGVLVRVNSLVLDPTALDEDHPAQAATAKNEPVFDDKPAKGKKGKKEKKEKEKDAGQAPEKAAKPDKKEKPGAASDDIFAEEPSKGKKGKDKDKDKDKPKEKPKAEAKAEKKKSKKSSGSDEKSALDDYLNK